MTSGKRNRSAGHTWERKLVEVFRSLGYVHVVTSRSESRSRDDEKVDLINKNERVNGQFVFNVQAKNSTQSLKYPKLLGEQPKQENIINVIAHKYTERSPEGTNFLPKGQFAILYLDDFLRLIKLINSRGQLLTPELLATHGTTQTKIPNHKS